MEARFHNPYDTARGSWSYGFTFRNYEYNRFHVVEVSSNKFWSSYTRLIGDGDDDQELGSGYFPHIRTGRTESNLIRVEAEGDTGNLYVNGQHVAELDLRAISRAGEVYLAANFFSEDGIPGEPTSTRFENFTVSMPVAPAGPQPTTAPVPTATPRLTTPTVTPIPTRRPTITPRATATPQYGADGRPNWIPASWVTHTTYDPGCPRVKFEYPPSGLVEIDEIDPHGVEDDTCRKIWFLDSDPQSYDAFFMSVSAAPAHSTQPDDWNSLAERLILRGLARTAEALGYLSNIDEVPTGSAQRYYDLMDSTGLAYTVSQFDYVAPSGGPTLWEGTLLVEESECDGGMSWQGGYAIPSGRWPEEKDFISVSIILCIGASEAVQEQSVYALSSVRFAD